MDVQPLERFSSPSIELFSPIPPLKTGTADYFSILVQYISSFLGARQDVVIAVNGEDFDDGRHQPSFFFGYPVVDYRDLPAVPNPNSTRIYFLANNAYHAYVHRMISKSDSLAGGKIITVVHDASLFMLSRHMYGRFEDKFTGETMLDLMRSQFGKSAKSVFEQRLGDLLPMSSEYEIHCLGATLRQSHEVWAHSLFALSRFLLENELAVEKFPTLRLVAHPVPHQTAFPVPKSDRQFVIGMFGWVTEPKRIDAILHGLALALQWLPAGSEERLLMRVVGRKPLDWDYHPDRVANRLGISQMIQFIDYPDKVEFESLQLSCDLTFNLRYPSTGETSGTFSTARVNNNPIITSRYHAFHEVGVKGATVTSLPMLECWSIAETIVVSFERWLKKIPVGPTPLQHSLVAPVEKLLLLELAEKLNL